MPETRYPTSSDLSDLRRDFALADPKAPFHELAKARIARGQPWNGRPGTMARAYPHELENGIGLSNASPYLSRPGDVATMRSSLSGFVLFGPNHI